MAARKKARRKPTADYDGEGLPGWGFGGTEPTVTIQRSRPGRNPHVGLNIPKPTKAEAARRKAARKKKGTVRAVKKRKRTKK